MTRAKMLIILSIFLMVEIAILIWGIVSGWVVGSILGGMGVVLVCVALIRAERASRPTPEHPRLTEIEAPRPAATTPGADVFCGVYVGTLYPGQTAEVDLMTGEIRKIPPDSSYVDEET